MGNIIPFKNIDISKISDDLFDEIENYLKECFNKEIRKSSGNIPIFEAKKGMGSRNGVKSTFDPCC